MSTNPMGSRMPVQGLALKFPQTLAVYDDYQAAQKAVDHLADNDFPVQNVMIVGTDLKQVERVTGRLTQQKVALGGLLSGLWMGLFVGLIFSLFDSQGMTVIVTTMLFGAIFGIVWAMIGYAMTRGRRDFTSVQQVVATKYEVLVEHNLHPQAVQMLSGMPGGRPNWGQPQHGGQHGFGQHGGTQGGQQSGQPYGAPGQQPAPPAGQPYPNQPGQPSPYGQPSPPAGQGSSSESYGGQSSSGQPYGGQPSSPYVAPDAPPAGQSQPWTGEQGGGAHRADPPSGNA